MGRGGVHRFFNRTRAQGRKISYGPTSLVRRGDIQAFDSEANALDWLDNEGSFGPESVIKINFLRLPITKDEVKAKTTRSHVQRNKHVYGPVVGEIEHPSTGGRLIASKDRGAVLLESPWERDNGPYLFLRLAKNVPGSDESCWSGILIYDTEDFDSEILWSSMMARDQEQYPDHTLQDLKSPPFDIVAVVAGWYAEKYLRWVQQKGSSFGERIDKINDDLIEIMEEATSKNFSDQPTKAPSRLMLELNRCSNDMRTSQLEQQTTFGNELSQWASDIMHSADYRLGAHDLRALASRGQMLHPDRLRERIAEIRVQISEVAAQKRQEREERQRETEMNLQKLRDEMMRESKRDSRTTRGIAYLTMAFLPATFVTSFFGMNFFNVKPGMPAFDDASQNVWIFFVVAVPISVMVILMFWLWDKKQEAGELARQRSGAEMQHQVRRDASQGYSKEDEDTSNSHGESEYRSLKRWAHSENARGVPTSVWDLELGAEFQDQSGQNFGGSAPDKMLESWYEEYN